MFAAFLRKFPSVFRAYMMEVPKNETPEQKAERIEEFGEDSQKGLTHIWLRRVVHLQWPWELWLIMLPLMRLAGQIHS